MVYLQVLEMLPIGAGLLSEEGSECTNKIFRMNRTHHARQNGVQNNLLDCFTRSHYQADPRIQRLGIRKKLQERSKARTQHYSPEVLALFELPEEELQPPVENMDCD